MPHALIALPDVYESVIRRVAVDVMDQLVDTMRLPADRTDVRLPGYADTIPMNKGMFKQCGDSGLVFPGTKDRITVTFNENTSLDRTLETSVANKQNVPLFWDEPRAVSIHPVYRYMQLEMQVTLKTESVTSAIRWLDEMRARISMGRAELHHELKYHYAMPKPVMMLLEHLHSKIEASAVPLNLTFEQWLDQGLLADTTTIATLIDTNRQLAVKENQVHVIGWFDFDDSPQAPEKDSNESGTFNASFTYTLNYQRPSNVYCQWPLLMHNVSIDEQYRPQEPYGTYRENPRKVSRLRGAIEGVLDTLRAKEIPYVQHPEIDDWCPRDVPKNALTFFSGLLVISADQPRQLVDLSELGNYTFTPYFLEYFFHQGDRVLQSESVFEFRLYENDLLRNDITLRFIPGTLTVQTDKDLDLTKFYHLQISLKRDWEMIPYAALECLRRYPIVAYILLRAVGVLLGGGRFEDLPLLGKGHVRLPSVSCPGEGALIGPPRYEGTWPWPWLDTSWDGTAWPGCGWTGNGWPGCLSPQVVYDLPTWFHECDKDPRKGGIVPENIFRDAVRKTRLRASGPIDQNNVGPLLVLYGSILAIRK